MSFFCYYHHHGSQIFISYLKTLKSQRTLNGLISMRRCLSHLFEDLIDDQQDPFTLRLSSNLVPLQHSLDFYTIDIVIHYLKLCKFFHRILNLRVSHSWTFGFIELFMQLTVFVNALLSGKRLFFAFRTNFLIASEEINRYIMSVRIRKFANIPWMFEWRGLFHRLAERIFFRFWLFSLLINCKLDLLLWFRWDSIFIFLYITR